MLKRKTHPPLDERLDRAGREIVRASLNEAEAEQVAASPFLYARVRARIAEREQRQEAGENWLAMLMVAWRAVPAMALVALFAFGLFWFAGFGSSTFGGFSDDAFFGASDAGMARVIFEDRRPLSQDEIFTAIVGRDESEVSR